MAQVWSPAQHRQLLTLCQQHGVEKLWVFGSAATGTFDPTRSDLDFEALMRDDLTPEELGDHVLALYDELPALFGRDVDLLTNHPIRNPYLRASIERSRILLYDRSRSQVVV